MLVVAVVAIVVLVDCLEVEEIPWKMHLSAAESVATEIVRWTFCAQIHDNMRSIDMNKKNGIYTTTTRL